MKEYAEIIGLGLLYIGAALTLGLALWVFFTGKPQKDQQGKIEKGEVVKPLEERFPEHFDDKGIKWEE